MDKASRIHATCESSPTTLQPLLADKYLQSDEMECNHGYEEASSNFQKPMPFPLRKRLKSFTLYSSDFSETLNSNYNRNPGMILQLEEQGEGTTQDFLRSNVLSSPSKETTDVVMLSPENVRIQSSPNSCGVVSSSSEICMPTEQIVCYHTDLPQQTAGISLPTERMLLFPTDFPQQAAEISMSTERTSLSPTDPRQQTLWDILSDEEEIQVLGCKRKQINESGPSFMKSNRLCNSEKECMIVSPDFSDNDNANTPLKHLPLAKKKKSSEYACSSSDIINSRIAGLNNTIMIGELQISPISSTPSCNLDVITDSSTMSSCTPKKITPKLDSTKRPGKHCNLPASVKMPYKWSNSTISKSPNFIVNKPVIEIELSEGNETDITTKIKGKSPAEKIVRSSLERNNSNSACLSPDQKLPCHEKCITPDELKRCDQFVSSSSDKSLETKSTTGSNEEMHSQNSVKDCVIDSIVGKPGENSCDISLLSRNLINVNNKSELISKKDLLSNHSHMDFKSAGCNQNQENLEDKSMNLEFSGKSRNSPEDTSEIIFEGIFPREKGSNKSQMFRHFNHFEKKFKTIPTSILGDYSQMWLEKESPMTPPVKEIPPDNGTTEPMQCANKKLNKQMKKKALPKNQVQSKKKQVQSKKAKSVAQSRTANKELEQATGGLGNAANLKQSVEEPFPLEKDILSQPLKQDEQIALSACLSSAEANKCEQRSLANCDTTNQNISMPSHSKETLDTDSSLTSTDKFLLKLGGNALSAEHSMHVKLLMEKIKEHGVDNILSLLEEKD